jgi:hypothetical protein
VGQPGHTDAIPFVQAGAPGSKAIDDANDLMTRDDSGVLGCEVTLGEVEVGTTDAADSDSQAYLTGFGDRDFLGHP